MAGAPSGSAGWPLRFLLLVAAVLAALAALGATGTVNAVTHARLIDDLARYGRTTRATVATVRSPYRGPSWATVVFEVDGKRVYPELPFADQSYRVGAELLVMYDPRDPRRVARVSDVRNGNGDSVTAAILSAAATAVLSTLLGLVVGAGLRRWRAGRGGVPRYPHAPASEQQIRTLTVAVPTVPAAYVAFLRVANGGRSPRAAVVVPDGHTVHGLTFLGVGLDRSLSPLGWRSEMPDGLLPAAVSGDGSVFALSTADDRGSVWYYDFRTGTRIRCASSWPEFIDGIR